MGRPRKEIVAQTDDDGIIEGEALSDEQADLIRERPTPKRSRVDPELSKPVGADGELSGLDARLLTMAASHKSPEEMSEELGGSISPARAAQRVREILSSRDWLSHAAQEQLVMQEMVELKDRLKNLIARWDEADYLHGLDPRMIAMLQKMLTDLLKAVEQRRKAASTERITIRTAHAALIVSAIERSFRMMMHELSEHYKIDEIVARDALEAALPRAIEAIQEHEEAA